MKVDVLLRSGSLVFNPEKTDGNKWGHGFAAFVANASINGQHALLFFIYISLIMLLFCCLTENPHGLIGVSVRRAARRMSTKMWPADMWLSRKPKPARAFRGASQ